MGRASGTLAAKQEWQMMNGAGNLASTVGQDPKQPRMLTADQGVFVPYERVRNKPDENYNSGSMLAPPKPYKSWRGYWEHHSGGIDWPKVCPVQNTVFRTDDPDIIHVEPCDEEIDTPDNGVGARVQLLNEEDEPQDDTVHIAPLCKWHNMADRNAVVLKLDDLLLVKAPPATNTAQLSFPAA